MSDGKSLVPAATGEKIEKGHRFAYALAYGVLERVIENHLAGEVSSDDVRATMDDLEKRLAAGADASTEDGAK
jgi:hypothetical protein